MWSLQFGASVDPSGVQFRLWAPRPRAVQVVVRESMPRMCDMQPDGEGEFACEIKGLEAGADYMYVIDGRQYPDPVSRWQPAGVHGPSRVVDPAAFEWSDGGWRGIPLEEYVIYELHTGTFTPEGTLESVITHLPYLRDLGVTAVELMPVAQFPGRRNWGYDGVDFYAPQSTYGGPEALKMLVDACHREGLAFVLDVVYNHAGPEGNYLGAFGPYFTSAYRTPWGEAINYDGPESDGVRRFVVDNALYWLTEYHVDALRLDAVHGIYDFGARHILREMSDAFHAQARELGRAAWLIAESDLNDPRVIHPPERGGYRVDAQWLDEFHHSLHTALTPDTRGYFADFNGVPSLARCISDGFVYQGQYSLYRRRRFGAPSADCPGKQFVAFTQNHDQIGNARQGIRSSEEFSLDRQKLAAALLLFSPFLPLLFMGQEYGETAPFAYFTDHGDAALSEAVRQGRKEEMRAFMPGAEFLDPQAAATFERSKLDWNLRSHGAHASLLSWYRACLALRKEHACLNNCRKDLARVAFQAAAQWLTVERNHPSGARAILVCNFASEETQAPVPEEPWTLCLWSRAEEDGPAAEKPELSHGVVRLRGISAALYMNPGLT